MITKKEKLIIVIFIGVSFIMSSDRVNAGTNNSSELLRLAKEEFGNLTKAEEKLFQAVANAQLADYSAKDAKDNDPADANNWGPERVIKADRIAWLCRDNHASELVTHNGIWVKGARVDGRIELNGARISFLLFFDKSALPEGISVVSAELFSLSLPGTHTGPITADGLKVKGSVFLQNGFKAKGEVRLLGATIGGELSCIDGQFINPNGHALNAERLKVNASVFLRDGFRSEGEVDLLGASIRGNLECNKGQFVNPDGFALAADKIRVEGNVLLGNGFISEGEVFLIGATIGGNLNCQKGQFINPDGRALNANRLKVEGNVYLRNGFKAEGKVRLLGATIGGNLECDKSQFINPDACALDTEGVKVAGNVFLGNGFKAKGNVSLIGATIGRILDCEKGQFINPNGHALSADGLKVEGSVFLRDGFKADGTVSFVDATVRGYFVWSGVDSPEKVELDLRSARIGTMWDDKKSWPDSGKLFLHGLIYDEIVDVAPSDAKTRIEWLRRQYDEEAETDKKQFRPQPYEQLAEVLKKSGNEDDAKEVLIAKNKDRLKWGPKLTFSRFLWYKILEYTIGYGYKPSRALLWVAACIILGCILFKTGYSKNSLQSVTNDPPKFNSLVYSIDTFVPLVDLYQAKYWLPKSRVLRLYHWVHIAAGWILTTLLVIGLTGLVRT